MNLRKDFTNGEIEFLLTECNFTQDEWKVFTMSVRDTPRVVIADKLSVSLATVDRRIKDIKRKIEKVLFE